jgi:hypothetical protein
LYYTEPSDRETVKTFTAYLFQADCQGVSVPVGGSKTLPLQTQPLKPGSHQPKETISQHPLKIDFKALKKSLMAGTSLKQIEVG